MTSGGNYNTATYCPNDTFSIGSFSPADGTDFTSIDNVNGKISFAPHVNKVKYIGSYTVSLTHATSYVHGGSSTSFAFTVTVGSLCSTKQWKIPTASMPSAVLTGADSQTLIDRTLENDLDGTSWTGVCSYTATLSLISAPAWITILSSTTLRILPTLVAHEASHSFTLR